MGHILIDGVLAYRTDPAKPIAPTGWTDEAYELERDYGLRELGETHRMPTPPDTAIHPGVDDRPLTIEDLLVRAAALSWRVKVIETQDRDGNFIWWADLYCHIRVSRKHGYGPSLAIALAAALDAEEVAHDVPFRHHDVAKERERPKEAAFVRRF